MSLALLVGASPRICKNGPIVRVRSGKYKILKDGFVDSEFQIIGSCGSPFPDEAVLILDKPNTMQIQFTQRGNEQYVSVSLEEI